MYSWQWPTDSGDEQPIDNNPLVLPATGDCPPGYHYDPMADQYVRNDAFTRPGLVAIKPLRFPLSVTDYAPAVEEIYSPPEVKTESEEERNERMWRAVQAASKI